MTWNEKMVSADPGPELVPKISEGDGHDTTDDPRSPVIAGLEARADDPETAQPLDPHELVGERSAKGSADNPG